MKRYLLVILLLTSNSLFSQWSDVGLGTDQRIHSLYVDSASNLLFVGGEFHTAGGVNINNIATWDGNNWSEFGNNDLFTSPEYIGAIVNYNGSIIVGGDFDSIGNQRVNNIARWTGSEWEPMGNGFNYMVNDLIVYKGDLYAGGSFNRSGNDTVIAFAKWNGSTWQNIVELMGSVNSFTIFNGNLILAGSFYYQLGGFIQIIMGWNGSSIDTSIHCYFNNTIIKVNSYNDTLIAVGEFTSIPLNNSNYISLYYNNAWHSIGNPTGSSNWVVDAIKYHSKLFFCGYFLYPPDLCLYNGSGFDSIADVAGFVRNLIEYKDELYAAGSFNFLNGNAMNNIARYNDVNISINELSEAFGINLLVYPNPVSDGHVRLAIRDKILINKMIINVYSIDNKLIFSESSNNFISEINCHLKKGVYIIGCQINDFEQQKIKLIVL